MFLACLTAFVGFAMLIGGAEFLVRGSVVVANKLKVPTLIIGLTFVAFGTTLPEFVICMKSAMSGNADIALGSVIGSNIANILLVLAISAFINPIKCKPNIFYRDFSFLALTALFFSFFATRGELARWNGWVLLLFLFWFVFYYTYTAGQKTAKNKRMPRQLVNKSWWSVLLATIGGVLGVAFGADFFLDGVIEIAKGMRISEEVISVTIIAVGTALPELATSCVAAYRKQNDIALGNIIGANIWNIVLIVGSIAAIGKIEVSTQYVVYDIWVMLFASFMLLPIMMFKHKIVRSEAFFMLLCYVAYLTGLFFIATGKLVL